MEHLKSVTCPECDHDDDVDIDDTEIICEYCGHQYSVEEE